MVWVREEYANELAVLSTWLCALLPWSVSVASLGGATLTEIRWPFLLVRYILGTSLGDTLFTTPFGGATYYAGDPFAAAFVPWKVAFVLFGATLALSVALFVREERVEALIVDPARVFGTLLGLSGLLLLAAWFQLGPFPGRAFPVGLVFMLVFAGVLLTVDRN